MVHDESPGTFIPGMHAFHNPMFGRYDEAIGIGLNSEKITLVRVSPTPNILIGRMSNHLKNMYTVALGYRLGTLPCIA